MLLLLTTLLSPPPVRADFQRTKIAVLDFELIGDKLETAGMGAILSEWFTTSIVKSGRFDVVERAMLQKILSEQKLAQTGIIDDTSASKLGRILGVKVIITGSVLRLGDSIEINSRVISVESGSIIAAENIRGDTSEDMHNLVDRLTAKIMRNFPLTGYVVKKNKGSAIIDLGLGSGLKTGTEFIVYREGEVIKHPKTGEVLDVEQIQTGRLRITRISRNVAEGKIISEEPEGIAYGQLVKSVQTSSIAQVQAVAPTQTVAPPTIAPPVAPPQPQHAAVMLAPEKKKVMVEVSDQPVQPDVEEPPAQPVHPDIYNVGIFPWVFFQDGDTFKTILADRIKRRIADFPKITLTHSAYHIRNIPKIQLPGSASEIWKTSYSAMNQFQNQAEKIGLQLAGGEGVNLPLLRQKGQEYGVHVAVIGKLNVVCRWSDDCQVRNMNITLVDIITGKSYTETGTAWEEDARNYIDRLTGKVFRKFAKDHSM